MENAEERAAIFGRVYAKNYGRVVAYARRRFDEQEADDVVAETFMVAWRRLDDVPSGDLALPWLYGVARNIVSEARRSRLRRGRLLARVVAYRTRDEDVHQPVNLDDPAVVALALAHLRHDDRELLRLADWEDLSHAQLAMIFDCTANAIAIRMHRANRRFAKALAAVDRESAPPSQRES